MGDYVTRIVYVVGIALMFSLLTPLAVSSNGATRWINIAGFQLQPVEVVKISTIVMLAKTDLEYRGYQIYKRPFSPAIIFYVIIEDVVHVLRILREEENWSLYFRNNENYEYTYPE